MSRLYSLISYRFTAYTAGHSTPADVEELIDFCDEAHRQSIADLGGVIRLVTSDVYPELFQIR